MKCDRCASEEASVHVTQVVQNQSRVLHLCPSCARELGFAAPTPPAGFPLGEFLAKLGGGDGEIGRAVAPAQDPTRTCAFCGLTFRKFRETGRLGCPHCYVTFEAHLRGLLQRIHPSTQHVGKVYLPPNPTRSDVRRRLETLRQRLQRAVDGEEFERAAELRDEIRQLEGARLPGDES